MNDMSALGTKGRADLAASGMNALTGGSFGSDFAVLLTQMSDTGAKGFAGALSSSEAQKGITGAPRGLSRYKRRARSDVSSNKKSGSLCLSDTSYNDLRSADKAKRANYDYSGKTGNFRRYENDRQRTMTRDQEDGISSSDGSITKTDSSDKPDEKGSEKADAQWELSNLNGNDTDLTMPFAMQGSEENADLSLADETGSSDALVKNAFTLSDEMSEKDPETALLNKAVSMASKDTTAGADTSVSRNTSLSGIFSDPDLKQGVSAQAQQDTPTDLSGLGLAEPEKVQTLSADSQALGELMSDAGVTSLSSTKPQFTDAGEEASDISDSLSNIADSIKAASELLPEQDQGGESGSNQDPAGDSMKEALMVLRQGGKNSDLAGQSSGITQDLAMAEGDVKASSAQTQSGMYEPSSALSGSSEGLSASRLNAREGLSQQSLRDTMLSLSSDVKANAEKITQAVMAMSARNLKSLHIELNPEGLGSMQIDIDSDSKDEAVRIGISASSSQARAILSQGMDALREGLMRNGIFAQAELSSGTDSGTASSDGGNSGSGQWQGSENNRQWRGPDASAVFASAPEESADPAIASPLETDDGALNLFA